MKKQGKKNHRNLLLCMGGLFLLIVFAFAGPELLLQLQDKSRLTRSVSITNVGTDYTVWKEDYETDTVRRLQNLADGIAAGKQYYASEEAYEATTDGVAIMAYDICVREQDPEDTGVSIECIVDSETGTLYAMKVVLENETEPVTWDDIGTDAPYYFINDYMQSYLSDYNSDTYIEIRGDGQTDANAQILWDKEAKNEAKIEAKVRTASATDTGECVYDLNYGENKLHLLVTLLNASEGQLEKGCGYLFGIREITEQIPDFLPDI